MASTPNTVIREVVEHLEALPPDLQAQVLALARELDVSQRQGVPGSRLLSFAGAIPQADLEAMSQAIERGCERVDLDEWRATR